MNHRHKPLILISIMLIAAALACNLGGRRQVELGETFQSDAGGFVLQKVPDFEFEEYFGMVLMTAPDVDPNIGPYIIAYGELVDEDTSSQEVLNYMKMTADDFVFGSEEKTTIDGIEGLLVDFSGVEADAAVEGKVFVATPRPLQEFYIIAMAPEEEWKDFEPVFDAVLGSLTFIEAQPFEFDLEDLDDFDDFDQDWDIEDEWEDPDEDFETPTEIVQEIRQWAVFAEASSEYSPDEYSAMQATGAPAVNACEENPRAWASESPDTEEYLILYYETPVNPTELVIHQSHNPSQVVEINFIDTSGETWLLWYGDPHESEFCPDVWTHTIALDEVFYTDTVIIWVDQSILGLGWVEIDAVELVGYPMGVTGEPVQDEPEQPAQPPVGDIPTNYSGLMAGPVYQGWISIVIGETIEADLDRIMTIEHKGTDTWPFREDHKISYLYDMPWEGMTGYISVTNDGWVYRMRVTSDTHPDDFTVPTVNRDHYDELKAIHDRDKAIPYAVMANILESPGFLRETYIGEEDGVIRSIYNWYNADGDRITGTFLDGVLTGAIGFALNYIPAP